MFNSARLSLARRRRKLTKKGLAELAGLDQKSIIRYEKGEVYPNEDNLSALSKILRFPKDFFFGDDLDEPAIESVSFRSLKSLLARDRDAALAGAAFGFLLNDWAEDHFSLPSTDLIDLKEGAEPDAAARHLRQKWGLGESPVRNMIHMLEAKGIRVFSVNESAHALDAFSMWRNGRPFVFLNTLMTAERSRFDAAHELGHLILHKHGGPGGGRAAEDEANQFASCFLMPEASVRSKLPRISVLNQIIKAKKIWGVSVAALNYRVHKLGITTDWQYRKFCIQIAQIYGKSEPEGLQNERSILWEKVLASLRANRKTKRKIADALLLPVEELEDLLFGLTNMQSIDGFGTGAKQGQGRAKLRLIVTNKRD